MTVQALRRGRPEVLTELLDRYGRDMQAVLWQAIRDLPPRMRAAIGLRYYGQLDGVAPGSPGSRHGGTGT